MNNLSIISFLIIVNIPMANNEAQVLPLDGNITTGRSISEAPVFFPNRNVIAEVGDPRSILGPAGKNIIVCPHGDVIAVMYGPPSDPYDETQPFAGVRIAYSTDTGMTWSLYGPFNAASPLCRIYPGLDGCGNFCAEPGNLYFAWQESPYGYATNHTYVMKEENVPATPSFSIPYELPNNNYGWMPCVGIKPDDSLYVMITAWNYLANGDSANCAWISTNRGLTWSDTIVITGPVRGGGAGHFRWGTNGYAFFTYLDEYNGGTHPFFVETTDAGYSWTTPAPLPAPSTGGYWWHEFDCDVIDDKPFAVYHDISESDTTTLVYPYPSDPGGPGSWNWYVICVDSTGNINYTKADTTFETTFIQNPNISYDPIYGVILVSYVCYFSMTPPRIGWTNGNYIGGIYSLSGGDYWRPVAPLSGIVVDAIEVAHRLVSTYASGNYNFYSYATWTDAGNGFIGNQYFERGSLQDIWDWLYPDGVAEENVASVYDAQLEVLPSVVHYNCRISYHLPTQEKCNIRLFDVSGRLVKTITDGYLDGGQHSIYLNTSNLANGVYMLRFESTSVRQSVKFTKLQ